jgi:hypothetical protein
MIRAIHARKIRNIFVSMADKKEGSTGLPTMDSMDPPFTAACSYGVHWQRDMLWRIDHSFIEYRVDFI